MAKGRRSPPPTADRPIQPAQPQQASVSITEYFSGPVPDPLTIARYGEVYPDAPRIIFEMAQAEQSHRHAMDKRRTDILARGQLFAFAALLASLLLAGYLLATGRSTEALGAVLVAVMPAILAFLYLRRDPTPGNQPALPDK